MEEERMQWMVATGWCCRRWWMMVVAAGCGWEGVGEIERKRRVGDLGFWPQRYKRFILNDIDYYSNDLYLVFILFFFCQNKKNIILKN